MQSDDPLAPESTIDTTMSASDSIASYQFGYSVGTHYSRHHPSTQDPNFQLFAFWRKANRERLNLDSLRQMAGTLTGKPSITQPDAESWLLSYADFIPPTADLAAVLHSCAASRLDSIALAI